MAQLAIKGHATRGREVIELLEMLGGKNVFNYDGTFNGCYIIDYNKICTIYTRIADFNGFVMLTLEELLEKFPFKVGDKVLVNGMPKTIKGMNWNSDSNEILYKVETNVRGFAEEYHVFAYDIQPYKEEIMEERQYKELRMPLDDDDKLATEVTIDGNKILPPNGYLIGKITQLDNGMFVEYVKTQSQYPKTYEECCKVLGLEYIGIKRNENNYSANCYKNNLICAFVELLICRDAYWKIAGEQMGLGRPWEPDWDNEAEDKYSIVVHDNPRCYCDCRRACSILTFPTEEMRDAFFENFDKDIDLCKEFL